MPGRRHHYRARRHRVMLADGDQLVLHDDRPTDWQTGDRAALLIHGLAGCHESGYMQRIAHKLAERGVRAFRMDLRGAGAGRGLARLPYHSGRSEDAAAAIDAIARFVPESPLTLVGFSLGGNIALKLAGELAGRPCGHLDSVMAVCPPVDLAACSQQISKWINRPYDRFFVRLLLAEIAANVRFSSHLAGTPFPQRPRSMKEFDDAFTAIVCGFGTADNYYATASSLPLLRRIEVSTLILSAADDPMIPPDPLAGASLPPAVRLHMTDYGGHLGFIGRRGVDADRRWMDWRVVDWVLARGIRAAAPAAQRNAPVPARQASVS